MFLSNFKKIKCNFLSKVSFYKNLTHLNKYITISNNLSDIKYKSFTTYHKQSPSKDIDFGVINEILDLCQLEPKMQPDYVRVKYCPLCEKPHHEESTNLYTLIVYKQSHVFHCFRCGNKGSFVRLFKILNKLGDLSKYKDLFMKKPSGYSSNGGNTTDNDDYQAQSDMQSNYLTQEIPDKNISQVSPQIYNQNFNQKLKQSPQISNNFEQVNSFSDQNFKISLNNTGLINELYRRNLLITNPKCQSIMDYLINERKLTKETLNFYKIGVSYEKFKSNSYDYINLPCVTYPMFYPTDKNSLFALERGFIDDNLYNFYNCEKFYLARLKVRAIGKEFKHFQKMEPVGSVLWGLFGLDTVPQEAEEIIITEGEYDAMAAYQVRNKIRKTFH